MKVKNFLKMVRPGGNALALYIVAQEPGNLMDMEVSEILPAHHHVGDSIIIRVKAPKAAEAVTTKRKRTAKGEGT